MPRRHLTTARIIALTKAGFRRAEADGFAITPLQPRHVRRLAELKATLFPTTPPKED